MQFSSLVEFIRLLLLFSLGRIFNVGNCVLAKLDRVRNTVRVSFIYSTFLFPLLLFDVIFVLTLSVLQF